MNQQRVAIIGSGFGGLATAIRLRSEGFEVTILEKRDKPGGRAYVYEQDGFTFDAGPTVVTAPEALRELFEVAGRPMDPYVRLIPISPMYRLHWEDGKRFDYTDDLEHTLAQIREFNPEDARRYPEFLEYTRQVFEEGYTKLAHVPFLNWWSMVRVSPQLLRLQAFRSVYSMVGNYIRDPQLRQAFSFHSLLVGGNPFSTSSIYTLIHYLERKWGVYFAQGGTGALVNGLVRLFEDLGGEIRYGSEVREITTEGGAVTGVRTDAGWEAFDAVVSNGDVVHTYRDLLGREPLARRPARRLARSRHSMSLFVAYFGTRRKYPQIAHHNILFCNRYRELLADIFDRGVLAEDFSLYLHAPTVTDPSLAPEGCENFYVLSPVPHLGKGEIDWRVEGPRYAERILKYLESRYLPDLRKEILTQRIFTPLDFKTELNAHWGSAFSLEPVLHQSAYFRVHNRDARIRGLYFVGAGTHPGAGIPGVVGSAKATAGLVRQQFRERETVSVRTPAPEVAGALQVCRDTIQVGSKSFSLASRFFPSATRDAAHFLYGWCRHCDDQIDGTKDSAAQVARLGTLREQTERAFAGEPVEGPMFVALQHIARRYRIPSYYATELLEGMEMDIRRQTYANVQDLSLYCYRVAGTVGLMMSHVMGVSDEKALRHAADMGTAMQLTNIARDVMEDAAMGRVYLPLNWLKGAGVTPDTLTDPSRRKAVAGVVARLLDTADDYYKSGLAGLKYLPWRAAFTVAIAYSVYSEIGRQVRRRGERAWDSRTVVSLPRKLWMVGRGLRIALCTVPYRVLRPRRSRPITIVWRHS